MQTTVFNHDPRRLGKWCWDNTWVWWAQKYCTDTLSKDGRVLISELENCYLTLLGKREGCIRTGEARVNSFYLFLSWRYKPTSKIGPAGLGHLVYPLVSLSSVQNWGWVWWRIVWERWWQMTSQGSSWRAFRLLSCLLGLLLLRLWAACEHTLERAHRERNRGIWPTTLADTYVKLSLWAP